MKPAARNQHHISRKQAKETQEKATLKRRRRRRLLPMLIAFIALAYAFLQAIIFPDQAKIALGVLAAQFVVLLWWMRDAPRELRIHHQLVMVFGASVLSVLFALFVEIIVTLPGSLDSLSAGPIEEASKIAALWLWHRWFLSSQQPTLQRVLAWSFAVAAGFAFYENILYLAHDAPLWARALPGHLIYAAIWAPAMFEALVYQRITARLVLAWLMAASVHALWNSALLLNTLGLEALFPALFLLILGFGLRRVHLVCRKAGFYGLGRKPD